MPPYFCAQYIVILTTIFSTIDFYKGGSGGKNDRYRSGSDRSSISLTDKKLFIIIVIAFFIGLIVSGFLLYVEKREQEENYRSEEIQASWYGDDLEQHCQ